MAKQPFEEKSKGDSGNPKEDAIEVMATVIEPLPNAMFRVELEKQAPGAGACFRQDEEELHPDIGGGQGRGGAFAVRFDPRPHRVPL